MKPNYIVMFVDMIGQLSSKEETNLCSALRHSQGRVDAKEWREWCICDIIYTQEQSPDGMHEYLIVPIAQSPNWHEVLA